MTADDATCDRWYQLRNAMELCTRQMARYLGCQNTGIRPYIDINNKVLRDDLVEMYPVAGSIGPAGADGKSAYELAQIQGFVGTLTTWLASLQGPQGVQGIAGVGSVGPQGPQGSTGLTGATGGIGATGAAGTNGTNGTPLQRIRAVTNASGVYTFTYPTPYASGVIPVIEGMEVEDSTGGSWNVVCTAINNVSMTVLARKTTAVTVATISVLGALVPGAITVHLGVTAP